MPKLTRRQLILLCLLLVGMLLPAAFAPRYSRLQITGTPDGDIDVEQVGFSPQSIKLKVGDAEIETQAH